MNKQYIVAGIIFCLISNSIFAQWTKKQTTIETRWSNDVNPENVFPEYPRPQLVRSKWINLNGLWDYAITDTNANFFKKFDGKILVPYPIESSLSGIKKSLQPNQLLWYKRTINRPIIKNGERVLLHFGAVDFDATVFVNGNKVGNHKGGYQNFTFDITNVLNSSINELTVKVWDPTDKGLNPHGKQILNPEGIMYTPSSGIWQTVWMEVVPKNYVEGLAIITDINHSIIKVKVTSPESGPIILETDGKVIKGKSNEEVIIPIKNAKLWSPDNPFLYDLQIRLGTDEVSSYFGMRKIEVKKDEKGIDRIFLNNRYIYNLGTLDQGFWPDGLYTAPTDAALQFDIKAIKAMGFNTIRKHIKIEPDRWYYYTDKLGMLVWQDMVNPGNDSKEAREEFEKENKENIKQLYNHPSIITWVLFNEKWGQYDQERLTKQFKQLDTTRLINGHSGEMLYVNDQLRSSSPNAWIGSDVTDVHAYPMPGHLEKQVGKAAAIGEFGGIGVPVEGHLWNDLVAGWGYDGVVTPPMMQRQYAVMIDSLKILETQGLSASIYTQPFDVESEQNGLMTYDREIIKLPVEIIRNIHAKLWPVTANYGLATKGFSANTADTIIKSYAASLQEYNAGKRDSALLRRLAIMAKQNRDAATADKVSGEYMRIITTPLAEKNLSFIVEFTNNTKSPGFSILYDNLSKVNDILGRDLVEAKLTSVIENDEIAPLTKKGMNPDWDLIEKTTVEKYKNLGEEIAWQTRVLYDVNNSKWEDLANILMPWFQKYGRDRSWISPGLINEVAWVVFQHANNYNVLEAVSSITADALQKDSIAALLDTHANLLYKLGRKKEALQWQEKAMASDPGNEEIKMNFEKMKKGEATWTNAKE